MNNDHEHDYHTKAAPDVSIKASAHIWLYFIALGILLFITIAGLTIFFRFQLKEEEIKKIGEIETQEILDYKSSYQPILQGKKGIFDDKKSVSIEKAIFKFLEDAKMAVP